MLVYGCNSEDGVLPHVCMAMLQASSGRREKRFDKLGLPKLAQES
jgi:hypothetical protein